MKLVSTTMEILGVKLWLSGEQIFVVVFLRFSRALWFVLSAVQSIADPNENVPSEPKLNV